MRRMPDVLSVCMQDFLHGGKSELREDEISGLKGTTEDGTYKQRWNVAAYYVRYARRAAAVPARAGIRWITVIERHSSEMSGVSRIRWGKESSPI